MSQQGAIAVRLIAAGSAGRLWAATLFTLGFSIGLLMVRNSQLSGDQMAMLDLGWQLARHHVWVAHGMLTSAGGYSPGGLTGLLTGIQLLLWSDYRSPALFILIFNGAAFLLLMRTVRPALTESGQLLLLLLVWLSPWHLYFSSHLWDPNYMFVFAVLHLATAQRMWRYDEVWTTAAHVLILGLGVQIHTSAAVLCILSLLLYLKGLIRVNWKGFALGLLLCVASLVPWMLAVSHQPELMPWGKGFPLRGLLYVFPLLRGILYWVKISSLSLAGQMEDFNFAPTLGVTLDTVLRPLASSLTILTHVSVVACGWLQWRYFRKRFLLPFRTKRIPSHPRGWLQLYVAASLWAGLIAFALSPTTIMHWQVLVALPASTLAVIMSTEVLARSRFRLQVRRVARVWSVAAVALLFCEAAASPIYRCGTYRLQAASAILADLHVSMECFNANGK
jgi:hypothetical protein